MPGKRPNSETASNVGPKGANVGDKEPVTVYDETRNANVCNLCGSADVEAGYGMAGGGGPGVYNFCNGCQRVLDKSPDSDE